MRKVKDAVDLTTNEKIYFKGHAKATYLSDGRNVEDALGEIPSGESSVFEAEYGVTTYDEVSEAYNQGKIIHCDYESRCYELAVFTGNIAWFSCLNTTTSYLLMLNADSSWSKASYGLENAGNRVDTIQADAKPYQYPSAKAVYAAIQQSGTPSGDPMHYMFEAVGATYNATEADIPMVGIYGDSYVHKAKHWHLNELGDITNEEMRLIYANRMQVQGTSYMYEIRRAYPYRTLLNQCRTEQTAHNEQSSYLNARFTTFNVGYTNTALLVNFSQWIRNSSVRKIIGEINVSYQSSASGCDRAFDLCANLEYLKLHGVKFSFGFATSSLLSNSSILYMIQNEAATSAIVITLHADAYARAMADDEITAALAAHPNVSLASA